MKNPYRDKVAGLLERVHPKLAAAHTLEFKNFFGAVMGYIDGNIFISSGKFGIALKLPKETLDELFARKDVKHLKYFSKGHIKKEYAVLPARILNDKKQLKKLVDNSIKYISQ